MCTFHDDYDTGYRDFVECCEAKRASDKLFFIEQMMRQLVKLLYNDDRLDVAVLDDCLGQICDSLGYELPAHLPRVRRHGTEFFEFAASINQ